MRHNGNIPSVSPFCDEGKWNEIVKQRRKKNNELTWELWGMRVNKTIKQQWSKKKKQQYTHVDRTRYKHEKHTRIGYQQLICCISLAVYIDAILHHWATAAAKILLFLRIPSIYTVRCESARTGFTSIRKLNSSFQASSMFPYAQHIHMLRSLLAIHSTPLSLSPLFSVYVYAVQTEEEQESTHQPIQ